LKRSGFVQSDSTSSAQKRNSVYMLASGSCFEKRVQGQMVKLNVTSVAHPIYRYGYGLYAGLFL
jgi:CRISPR-associated protein Csm4